jgi:hypothetical protein
MIAKWSKYELEYLRSNYSQMTVAQIAKHLDRKLESVKSKASALRLRKRGPDWSKAELEILEREYPNNRTEDIATNLGRPIYSVYNKAYDLGLRKSAEFMASEKSGIITKHNCDRIGAASRFKKGQAPPNKGVRRPGWYSGRMKETQFKQGEMPHNHQPVGTIGVMDGYKKIKLAEPKTWELLHRHVWIQHNGPIPRGHAIVFKNGDRMNCEIENLECISRKELMLRNTLHNFPEPVKSAIHQLAGFKRRLNRYAKKQNSGPEKHAVRDNGASS